MARVAMLASARHPIRRPYAGGLEALTHRLAIELRRRGHDVQLYAAGDSDPALGVQPLVPVAGRLVLTPAARIDPSMVAEPFLEEHHAYLRVLLELVSDRVDVVHNHSLHYLPIAMSPLLPSPVLTTLHTPPTPWLEAAIATLPPAADATFVSVSEANARAWKDPARIHRVIHNGIPLDDWPVGTGTGEHVVWFGRIVDEKGPHLALAAAARAGVSIVLAGPVQDECYFASEIAPRLGSTARYAGHLDTPELAALVGSARACLVTPTWQEPYGLVVPEALACGTPIAGFANGALPELIDEACGVLVPSADVDALADAVHQAARLDRGDCRRWAETYGSMQAMTDRYEALYAELVG